MVVPCKEEQRRQTTCQPCNTVRSYLTMTVRSMESISVSVHPVFQKWQAVNCRF
jgi:hypothetical protein